METLKATAAVLALAFAAPAFAQEDELCASRDKVLAKVVAQFGEVQKGAGLEYDGSTPTSTIETYANSETGTWTLFRGLPNGDICYLTSGRDWLDVAPPKTGDPV